VIVDLATRGGAYAEYLRRLWTGAVDAACEFESVLGACVLLEEQKQTFSISVDNTPAGVTWEHIPTKEMREPVFGTGTLAQRALGLSRTHLTRWSAGRDGGKKGEDRLDRALTRRSTDIFGQRDRERHLVIA
jgi:hypothetical protein